MSLQGLNGILNVHIKQEAIRPTMLDIPTRNIQITKQNNQVDNTKISHSNDNELTPEQKTQKSKAHQKQLDEIAEMKLSAKAMENNQKAIQKFDKLIAKTNGECKATKQGDFDVRVLYDQSGREIKRLIISSDCKTTYTETPKYNKDGELVKRTTVNNSDKKAFMVQEYTAGKLVRKEDLTGKIGLETYSYDLNGNLATRQIADKNGAKTVEYYRPENSKEPYKDITTWTTHDNTEIYEERTYDDDGNLNSYVHKKNDKITESYKKNPDGTIETFDTGKRFGNTTSEPFKLFENDVNLFCGEKWLKGADDSIISHTMYWVTPDGEEYATEKGVDTMRDGKVMQPQNTENNIQDNVVNEKSKNGEETTTETLKDGTVVETKKMGGVIASEIKHYKDGTKEEIGYFLDGNIHEIYKDNPDGSSEYTEFDMEGNKTTVEYDKNNQQVRSYTILKDGTIQENPVE